VHIKSQAGRRQEEKKRQTKSNDVPHRQTNFPCACAMAGVGQRILVEMPKYSMGWPQRFVGFGSLGGVAAAGTELASSLNIINTATNKQYRQYRQTDSSNISITGSSKSSKSSNKGSHLVISLTREQDGDFSRGDPGSMGTTLSKGN